MPLGFSPGFLINDPDRAPFGWEGLRGITPARLAVFVTICTAMSISIALIPLVKGPPELAIKEVLLALGRNLVCGLPMFILVIKAELWTARSGPWVRISALAAAVVAGAVAYTALRWGLRALHNTLGDPRLYWHFAVAHLLRSSTVGAFLAALLYYEARDREAARLLQRATLGRIEIERQIVEARLQLLQAQIEPHFLFNSLASVKRLYAMDSGRARALFANLIEYLRMAVPQARRAQNPLAREIALARAFLEIFQARMGSRLAVRIDVAREAEDAAIPSLMLATLVENAIKHGVGPRGSGGTVQLTAKRDGRFVEICVRDDGVGFRTESGRGVGLANTRGRLKSLFGADGSLNLEANAEGGVCARVRLPYCAMEGGAP